MPITIFVSIALLALLGGYPISASPVSPHEAAYTLTPTTTPSPTHALTHPFSGLSYSTQAASPNAYTSPISNPIPLSSQASHQTDNRGLPNSSHNSAIEPTKTKPGIPADLSTKSEIAESYSPNEQRPLTTLSQVWLEARQTTPTSRQAPITLYGLYDAIVNTRLAAQNAVGPGAGGSDSKRTGLAPLAEVFQAMTRQGMLYSRAD
ncbi:hypothetical protein BJ165DRAFT_1527841 [Panaeolus papilionaceus]|nr:hypothetical protein BJ165DRAFT_1527841 [Panaeolus papilionaceus]